MITFTPEALEAAKKAIERKLYLYSLKHKMKVADKGNVHLVDILAREFRDSKSDAVREVTLENWTYVPRKILTLIREAARTELLRRQTKGGK